VELSTPTGKNKTATTKNPGFSICLDKKDGTRVRREYAFLTNVVRFAGEHPCEAAPPPETVTAQPPPPGVPVDQAPAEGFAQRVRRRVHALTHGLFGG
jgi:hypothetical protein